MADLILGSITDSITGHLVSLISKEIRLAWGVKGELRKLEVTVSVIGGLLDEVEKRCIEAEDVKQWLKKLKELFYDADDLLDDFSIEVLRHRRVMGRGTRSLNELRIFFSTSNQLVHALVMAHRVKDIRERINALSNDRVHFLLEGNRMPNLVDNRVRPETYPYESEVHVIGRDKDKKEVINFVLNTDFGENVTILPIVGLGGLGKTTLAKLVFNDKSVKEQFELKLWVCVSINFDVADILRKILRECTPLNEVVNTNLNQLLKKLGEELDGKRFLLVLDDVWNENRSKWLELEGFLRNGAKGSKILVTTRSPRVAQTMTPTYHQLSGLPREDSLSLLMRMAMKQESEWRNQNLEKIAKEILKKCAGVPLAIKTIGRLLLFSRNREEDWLNFKNNDLARLSQEEDDIMPSLKLSYDFLPTNLKQCFAYCCLFPKDYELKISELINLWMAQGFVKGPLESKKTAEEFGHDYFMELLSRSFFQDIKENKYGDIVSCKMHDLMHDLARLVAGENCFTTDCSYAKKSFPEGARHVSTTNIDVLKGFERDGRIRSLLFTTEKTRWIEIAHLDVSCFRNLRALRLCGANIKVASSSIGKLKYLRSLDLSGNHSLAFLPNSISKLCNLEVLNLRDCNALERLPGGITKLVNLRQLDVSGCIHLTSLPRGIDKLTSLQIMLGTFVVGEERDPNAAKLNELSRLDMRDKELTIRGLQRAGSGISSEVDDSFSIEKFALQCLKLEWNPWEARASMASSSEVVLESLRPHPELKELSIDRYNGVAFPSWVSQLHKLVQIGIEDCHNCTHLPPLDHLPSLKRLSLKRLYDLERIELSESCGSPQPNNFFPSLEEVELSYLSKFRGWERRMRRSGNGTNEEEDDDSLREWMLPVFSDKVKVSIEDCPILSYSHGEKSKHLWVSTIKMVQLLLKSVTVTVVGHNIPLPLAPQLPIPMAVPTPSTVIPLSSASLSTLTALAITDVEDAEHLPAKLFQSFLSLQNLEISGCPRLKALPMRAILRYLPALDSLKIMRCRELDLSFEEDEDEDDGGVKGHHQLRQITIWGIERMEALPGWFQYLFNLQNLNIEKCKGLKSLLPGRLILRLLTTLKSLSIRCCPELDLSTGEPEVDQEDMPDCKFEGPAILQSLTLWGINKMETLPWWIQHLTILNLLEIRDCSNMKALPEWFPNLKSLRILIIARCGSELWWRCQGIHGGEDWPKISHIPHISLN